MAGKTTLALTEHFPGKRTTNTLRQSVGLYSGTIIATFQEVADPHFALYRKMGFLRSAL